MKINVGTSIGNMARLDTRGIKFDDLTHRVVLALVMDRLCEKREDVRLGKVCVSIAGWAPSSRRGYRPLVGRKGEQR